MSENCQRCKKVPRTEEDKKKLEHRINRIAGQLNGVKNMLESDRYCEDVLVQLAAIEKSVRSLSIAILEEHIKSCIVENIKEGNIETIDEIIALFRRFQ